MTRLNPNEVIYCTSCGEVLSDGKGTIFSLTYVDQMPYCTACGKAKSEGK